MLAWHYMKRTFCALCIQINLQLVSMSMESYQQIRCRKVGWSIWWWLFLCFRVLWYFLSAHQLPSTHEVIFGDNNAIIYLCGRSFVRILPCKLGSGRAWRDESYTFDTFSLEYLDLEQSFHYWNDIYLVTNDIRQNKSDSFCWSIRLYIYWFIDELHKELTRVEASEWKYQYIMN